MGWNKRHISNVAPLRTHQYTRESLVFPRPTTIQTSRSPTKTRININPQDQTSIIALSYIGHDQRLAHDSLLKHPTITVRQECELPREINSLKSITSAPLRPKSGDNFSPTGIGQVAGDLTPKSQGKPLVIVEINVVYFHLLSDSLFILPLKSVMILWNLWWPFEDVR